MMDRMLISLLDQVKKKSLVFSQGTFSFESDHFFSILINPSNVLIVQAKSSTGTAVIRDAV